MHINVSLSKKNIINAIVFIIGLVLLGGGIISYYKYNHAIPLKSISNSNCKEGDYVTGYIDSYVGIRLSGSNKFLGCSQTWINITKLYDFYTVPASPDSYIRIMVSEKDIRNRLEAFTDGKGEGIYFEGIIEPAPLEFPNEWYAKIEDLKAEDVIKPYVIKESNFQNKKKLMYVGFLLMAFSVMTFMNAGGIKGIVEKEVGIEDDIKHKSSNEVRNYANPYSIHNELVLERSTLRMLEKRLAELRKQCIIGFVLLGMGVYMTASLGIGIISILLIIYSIRCIWKYFINSGSMIALFLVRIFGVDSISLKIRRCEDNLNRWGNIE